MLFINWNVKWFLFQPGFGIIFFQNASQCHLFSIFEKTTMRSTIRWMAESIVTLGMFGLNMTQMYPKSLSLWILSIWFLLNLVFAMPVKMTLAQILLNCRGGAMLWLVSCNSWVWPHPEKKSTITYHLKIFTIFAWISYICYDVLYPLYFSSSSAPARLSTYSVSLVSNLVIMGIRECNTWFSPRLVNEPQFELMWRWWDIAPPSLLVPMEEVLRQFLFLELTILHHLIPLHIIITYLATSCLSSK